MCCPFCVTAPLSPCRFFSAFSEVDYARAGAVVSEDVSLTPESFLEYELSHTLHDQLRKLSMPVWLDKGVLRLTRPHVVCSAGDTLSPEQAQLLKVFYKPLATFRVLVRCMWSDGSFKQFAVADDE